MTEFPSRPNSLISVTRENQSIGGASGYSPSAYRPPPKPDDDEGSFNLVTGPRFHDANQRDQQLTASSQQNRSPSRNLAAHVFDVPEHNMELFTPVVGRSVSDMGGGRTGDPSLRLSVGVDGTHSRSGSRSPASSLPYESDI